MAMSNETDTKVTEVEATSKKSSDTEISEMFEGAADQIECLKVALTDSAAEIESLNAMVSQQKDSFDVELSECKSRIEELEKELAEAVEAKDSAEATLNQLKEEALLNERLHELNDLRLLAKTEEGQIRQAEKVKAMSDEDYDSYKSELLDIFSVQTVEDTADETAEEAESTEEEEVTEEASEEDSEDATEEEENVDRSAEIVTETVEATEDDASKAKIKEILKVLSNSTKTEAVNHEEVEESSEEGEDASNKETASVEEAISTEKLAEAFSGIAYRK